MIEYLIKAPARQPHQPGLGGGTPELHRIPATEPERSPPIHRQIRRLAGHAAISDRKASLNFAGRLRTIFKEGVTSFDLAQNIVVIKTMPGLASAACAAIDGMEIGGLVGSLAGNRRLCRMHSPLL